MNAAVFLDRDNTLIHNDGDLGDPDEVRLIQGAATAIASLCGLGYKIVVVTNQGGVARGKYTEADVDRVHERLHELVQEAANGARIDRFYYCPYHPAGTVEAYCREHPNRKPQPGMLLEAAQDLDLDLSQSWTVGDQMRDVQAGAAAGTRTVLVRADADRLTPLDISKLSEVTQEPTPESERVVAPDFMARSLVEAVRIIAQQRKPDPSDDAQRRQSKRRKWDAAAVARLQRQASTDEAGIEPEEEAEAAPAPAEPQPEARRAPEPAARPRDDNARRFRPPTAPPPKEGRPREARAAGGRAASGAAVEEAVPHAATSAAAAVSRPQRAGAPVTASASGAGTGADDGEGEADKPWLQAPSSSAEKTLRLILQELRSQRGQSKDFSYLMVVAIVLQMVAGVCLLGGLWMAQGNTDLFLRWIGAGLIVQGATLATLLFGRQG